MTSGKPRFTGMFGVTAAALLMAPFHNGNPEVHTLRGWCTGYYGTCCFQAVDRCLSTAVSKTGPADAAGMQVDSNLAKCSHLINTASMPQYLVWMCAVQFEQQAA